MSLYLYLLRHGETTHSQTGGFCGSLDPELTVSGKQMAQAFADTYSFPHFACYITKGYTPYSITQSAIAKCECIRALLYKQQLWEAVFCSPMKRTIATAQPLCEAIGIEPQLRDGLKEINYGQWEDRTLAEVQEKDARAYMLWQREPAWNPPTDGETTIQIASRASLVIAEIEEKYTSGNVLVVSHKATIRIILCNLLGIDLGRYRDRIDMPVATVSVVKFDTYGPMLQRLGDRSHMPKALRDRAGT